LKATGVVEELRSSPEGRASLFNFPLPEGGRESFAPIPPLSLLRLLLLSEGPKEGKRSNPEGRIISVVKERSSSTTRA
jgi:hypothetical protein